MFGSQALETAIALALLFFLLATATSAAVEALSKVLKWRHTQLESAIRAMVTGSDADDDDAQQALEALKGTSAYQAVSAAAGKAGTSYLSAKSFADAVVELSRKAENVPPGLANRLNNLVADVGQDMLAVKAGVERWFDDAMDALESGYKKKATAWLFWIGLVIAVGSNASAVNVAMDLWNDTSTRQAVVAAAESISAGSADAAAITEVARTTDELQQLRFPVGWTGVTPGGWDWWLTHVAGWFVSAALIMLGAPFWFDLLGKLVSLRNGGKAPDKAADDKTSASRRLMDAGEDLARFQPGSIAGTGSSGLTTAAATLLGRVPATQ